MDRPLPGRSAGPRPACSLSPALILEAPAMKRFGIRATALALAVLVSMLTAGSINGIREGTLVAAVVVGFLVRLLHGPFRTVRKSLVKA